jgi:ribosomal protein S11
MLKQNKKLKSKYKYKNKKVILKIKAIQRLKKIFKHKSYFINPTFQGILNAKLESKIKSKITIKVTPNNVFCTFKDLKKNKTLVVSSAGKYKLNVSKKTLRFGNKIIIQNFIEEIKPFIKKDTIIINIQGPIKIRKSILKQITVLLKGVKFILKVDELKCFNGCRPPKKKRKKQKGLRIFK